MKKFALLGKSLTHSISPTLPDSSCFKSAECIRVKTSQKMKLTVRKKL